MRFEQLEARQYLSASPWTAVDADTAINPDELSYFRASNFETYTLDAAQLLSNSSAAGGLNSTDAARHRRPRAAGDLAAESGWRG